MNIPLGEMFCHLRGNVLNHCATRVLWNRPVSEAHARASTRASTQLRHVDLRAPRSLVANASFHQVSIFRAPFSLCLW